MDLLILGGNEVVFGAKGNPHYKGTMRDNPSYVESLPELHPVNQSFRWFTQNYHITPVVHDYDKARQLVDRYRQLMPPQEFEIVEVSMNGNPSSLNGLFLGYDLSSGCCESLLWWGLNITLEHPEEKQDKVRCLGPLFKLVQIYFQPKLNNHGLFADFQIASFCLDCMMALEKDSPNLWEKGNYHVVGLYKIYPSKPVIP